MKSFRYNIHIFIDNLILGPIRRFLWQFPQEVKNDHGRNHPVFTLIGVFFTSIIAVGMLAIWNGVFIYDWTTENCRVQKDLNIIDLNSELPPDCDWIYTDHLPPIEINNQSDEDRYFIPKLTFNLLVDWKTYAPEDWNIPGISDWVPHFELSEESLARIAWKNNYLLDLEYLERGLNWAGKDDLVYQKYHYRPTAWQAYIIKYPDYYPEDYESPCCFKWW